MDQNLSQTTRQAGLRTVIWVTSQFPLSNVAAQEVR